MFKQFINIIYFHLFKGGAKPPKGGGYGNYLAPPFHLFKGGAKPPKGGEYGNCLAPPL